MLAPEPFFEPRGTPFSEFHRIKALIELGHRVDLVTYPFGADVELPGLRIFRSARPPLARRVGIGPSPLKLVLDLLLAATAIRVARRERYDAIHSHEEAGVLGVWLARRHGIPHLYDMHSSLPQQLLNFRYSKARWLVRAFERMERHMVFGSQAVITICQELQDTVEAMGAGDRSLLIENVMGGDVAAVPGPGRAAVRAAWGIPESVPLVLYTGTFEPYQGLDLLFDASRRVAHRVVDTQVLVVGGSEAQVAAARQQVAGLAAPVVFTGQRPPHEIPHFVDACDVLASPRISGTNTPLKIYSYLRSGRPIVATRLLTHTQVLDEGCARLAEPTPEAFAEALADVLLNPAEGQRLAAAAARLSAERYSRAAYLARTTRACELLMRRAGTAAPSTDGAVTHPLTPTEGRR